MRSIPCLLLLPVVLTACHSSLLKIGAEDSAAPPAEEVNAARRPDLPPDTLDHEPPAVASDSAGIDRLVHLATIWSAVAHFHPRAHTVPLDSALVRAVPAVRAATSSTELRQALARFLSVLDDPGTGFVAPTISFRARPISHLLTRDSVLIVTAPTNELVNDNDAGNKLAAIAVQARSATRVVMDMRAATRIDDNNAKARVDDVVDEAMLVNALITEPLPHVRERRRVIGALYSQAIPDTVVIGGEPAAWLQNEVPLIAATGEVVMSPPVPARRGRPAQPAQPVARRIVVVANEQSILPSAVVALIASGRAVLYAEGTVDDILYVSHTEYSIPDVGTMRLRLAELVNADGTFGLRATRKLEALSIADSTAPSVQAALAAVRTGRMGATAAPAVAEKHVLPSVFDAEYPTMGARLLGVFRLWSAMRTLHAHRDSYDDDLDEVFRRAIARAEAATDARSYAAAVLDLATSMDDSGVELHGRGFDEVYGARALPFHVRLVEGRAVVTELPANESQRPTGIAVGDEITSVEGFPIGAWLVDRHRQVSASNDWMRQQALMQLLRRGASGRANLRVRGASAGAADRELSVERTLAFHDTTAFRPVSTALRDLGSGILYIDARTSSTQPVPALDGVRAVIIDARGAVTSRADTLALLFGGTSRGARVVRRGASAPCFAPSLRLSQQRCADERATSPVMRQRAAQTPYNGLVVVLVDERTNRAGEWLALQLEANGARLAGSATAGALAETSALRLPGDLTVTMPLEEIRREDGSQLHRVGLTPSIDGRPTLNGIRNGVDDVLDRTVQWVRTELDPPPRRRR